MTETSPRDQAKISALCREAKRLEEDALYSSKGHFNAEDTWVRRNYWLGVPATALGAIAGAALFKSQPGWASAFTLLASLLTGLMTSQAQRARCDTPSRCWSVLGSSE